jgi:hypothetical protein
MFKKGIITIIMLGLALSGFATIKITTNPSKVFWLGSAELLGSMEFEISDGGFNEASAEFPYFIRLRIFQSSYLNRTLVDQMSEDLAINQPIDLALTLKSADPDRKLVANRDTVSIVRWVRGENNIWIRINHSPTEWIQSGDSLEAPSADHKVSFKIGVPGERVGFEPDSQRNLPYNLRANLQPGSGGTDTFICSNLTLGGLSLIEGQNELDFEAIIFDYEADRGDGIYGPSPTSDAPFTGDFVLATAYDSQFVINQISEPVPVVKAIPEQASYTQIIAPLWLEMENMKDEDLLPGTTIDSALMFTAWPEGLGFDPEHTRAMVDGQFDVKLQDPIQMGETTVYQRALFEWTGAAIESPKLLLGVELGLKAVSSLDMDEIQVQSTFFARPNSVGPCGLPQLEGYGGEQWTVARLTSGRIIPHITATDGQFHSTLVVSSPKFQPSSYFIAFYNDSGETVGKLSGNLGARETQEIDLANELPAGVAYGRISEDTSAQVAVSYRAIGEKKAAAQLTEVNETATRWQILAGDTDLTYDGAAVVNTGNQVSTVTMIAYSSSGDAFFQKELDELQPGGKRLIVLSNSVEIPPGTVYEIITSQPSAVTALRGDYQSQVLWENKPVAIH